ncbi:GTP-binding protein [Nitrogeniibacter aestuarii]|uniref:GTP-binding protein n=1 Tax=Nitrogeniibacter aestuarii TaxID=2815343 RepID=UPI001D10394C|nr:ATP/GTP-binding protein [Nitrogeniibacter aestuarii]
MAEYKILITGTVGAGKTTAISAVADGPVVDTDVRNSDPSVSKATTTVGLDFGEMTLDNGDRIRLFGTPGQARFDFLWRSLSENAIGIIILSDNSRPDPLADVAAYLDAFADQLKSVPCTIGVGRMDTHPHPSLDDYVELATARGAILPTLDVDVRKRDDVALLIDTLLAQVSTEA